MDRLPPQEAIEKLRTSERLRLREVEKALAAVQKIPQQDLLGFKARIRHLRDVGCPAYLPQPGRGRVIDYSSIDALALFMALRLEAFDRPPMIVAPLANRISLYYWLDARAEMAGEKKDLYVIIYPPDIQPKKTLPSSPTKKP